MSRQQMQQPPYQPALTALLAQSSQQQSNPQYEGTRLSSYQQQQQQQPAPILSPYRSKQQLKGLGRQQPESLSRKSAKGLLRSASAATLPIQRSGKLAPLAGRSVAANASATDMWQADASKPTSSQQQQRPQQQQQQQAPQQQLRSSASTSALVAPRPGESWESQAFRSLPPNSYAGSHYFQTAPQGGGSSNKQATRGQVVHAHQYADGSVVEECVCERGQKLVEQERGGSQQQSSQQEEKESNYNPQQTQQSQSNNNGGEVFLSPSQIARANINYSRQTRPVDTSRQHSVYHSSFVLSEPTKAFAKLGRGYFASHNKSYIRSCLQDPGYGFQLASLRGQPQNDPGVLNFAAEITGEHKDPSKRLTSIIEPVNWPDTTNHKDFTAPSADLIRSYKRVGQDYRQAGNKSYIRCNLVDDTCTVANKLNSSVPNHHVNVPFTADTTHHQSFQDYTSLGVRTKKAEIKFGSETGPKENIWSQPWDDNMD